MIRTATVVALATLLTGCMPIWCTSSLQRGCDPMPKWRGYVIEGPRQ